MNELEGMSSTLEDNRLLRMYDRFIPGGEIMKYEIVKGNIVNASTDAIVLPANPMLMVGPGASAAIFEAAGRKKLKKACSKVLKQNGGKCEVGSAIPTFAFDLNEKGTKYIIHAIVPQWVDGEEQEYDNLCSAYLTSLKVADLLECTSVAFPLLASGNSGFDKELTLEIADRSFKDFEGSHLQKIVLIIYGDSIAALAKEKGYEYQVEIPDFVVKEKKNLQHQHESQAKRIHDLFRHAKDTAVSAMEEQINRVVKDLSDPERRQELLDKASDLVSLARQFIKKEQIQKKQEHYKGKPKK